MMYIVDTFSHVQNTSSRMSCRKRHSLEHMMPRNFESPCSSDVENAHRSQILYHTRQTALHPSIDCTCKQCLYNLLIFITKFLI